MSSEQTIEGTPDKCRDQAAATVATKLLNSAKKSLTKQHTKKAQLSLHKTSSSSAQTKSSARALAFSPLRDLNDTIEFKKTVSIKRVPKLQLATRKRKKPLKDDQDRKVKSARQETCSTASEKCCETERITPGILNIDQKLGTLKPCSVKSVSTLESDQNIGKKLEDESETDSQCERNLSASMHTCPACGEMLQHGRLVQHIQMCLEQHYEKKDANKDCQMMLKGETSDQNSASACVTDRDQKDFAEKDESGGSSSDYIYCQLCQKDLSHLNSHRRTLHINKCIDQEEKKKEEMKERQRALEAAKTKVLDCPMCGKVLRTAQSRKSHLKKCASSLGVEPEQLLAAVKRQEEEHLATLAAGILPSRPGRSVRQNSTSSRKGIGTLPKSKLDEETQLALALSSSLQPDSEEAGTSSSTAPNRRGRKNKREENHLLLKLSESEAAGRIEARVSDLIMMETEAEEEVVPPLPHLNQQSLDGQTVQWSADEVMEHCKMFWRLSSLENQGGESEGGSTDSLQYYVPALMPPVQVSTVVTGSKVRRMSEIPGRCRSQDKREQVSGDMQVDPDEEHTDGNLPPFSTQTAALLADMAAEADGMEQSTQLSSPSSQISDIEQQVYQDLLSTYSSLVNKHKYSDVTIHTAGSVMLYAHQVILSVRCPALLQLMDAESRVIDLCEWSPQCVLAVLQFVYAGDTQMNHDCLPSTLQLAHRLGLTWLAQICRGQLEALAASKTSRSSVDDSEHLSPSVSSKTSKRTFTKIQTAALGADDSKNKTTVIVEEHVDHEQAGPSVPEGGLQTENSSDSEPIQSISPRKRLLFYSKWPVHSQSQSPVREKQLKKTNDILSQSERVLVDDQEAAGSKETLQSESKPKKDSVRKFHDVVDNLGETVTDMPQTHIASLTLCTESEIQQMDAVSDVCGSTDMEGESAMEIVSYEARLEESSPTFKSRQSANVSCSGGVNEITPLKKEEGNEHQPNSVDDEIMADEARAENSQKKKTQILKQSCTLKESCAEKTQKKNAPSSKHSEIGRSPQSIDVESIEISDDDLFSSDDMDTSLISSANLQNSEEKNKAKDRSQGGDAVSEADKKPSASGSESDVQNESRKTYPKTCCREDVICEKTRTENSSYLVVDPQHEKQRCQQSSFDNSLSSISISAIECSYRHPSTSNQKHGQFQTSTPDVPSEDGHTHRTVSKVKLKDKKDILDTFVSNSDSTKNVSPALYMDFASPQATVVQNRDSTHLNDNGDKNVANESVSRLGNKQTPCMSVVEQDSLYVTPIVEHTTMRRTFQLVTPLPQHTACDSSHRTLVSHCTTKKSAFMRDTPVSHTNVSKTGERKRSHNKETDSRHPKEQRSSENSVHQTKQKTEESCVGANSSDSDLEIIDISIQDAPSPKFSTQSRLSSSQSRSQPTHKTTVSSPQKQSKPSPKKMSHLTRNKMPSRGTSPHQSPEGRTERYGSSSPYCSPSKINPSGSQKGFSQRSAESDKELLRVSELMSKEAEEDQQGLKGKDDAEPSDSVDTNRSTEDIWDGFDNLEDYNPDLYLGVVEKSPHSHPCSPHNKSLDSTKTPSPDQSPKSVSKSPSKPTSHVLSPFKTPTHSPRKSREILANKSTEKLAIPSTSRAKSPVKQTGIGKTYSEHETPVKFRSRASDIASTSKKSCKKRDASASEVTESSQRGDLSSSGFLLGEEDGFLLANEDTEAANSSFLWSEENAPSDDCVMTEEEDSEYAVLEKGRKETVLTQKRKQQQVYTPRQAKESNKASKNALVPPSPFTPMPVYDEMTTPQLKNEVQKYGLKPVGKKRMKLVLKDIYHKTHQYETDSDYEEDSSHLPNLDPPVLHKETNPPLAQRQSEKPRSKPATKGKKPSTQATQTVQRQRTAAESSAVCRQTDPSKPRKRPKTKRGLAQKGTGPEEAPSTSRIPQQSHESEPRFQLGHPTIPSYQSPTKGRGDYGAMQKKTSPFKAVASCSSSPEKGLSSSQDSDTSGVPDVSIFEEERLDSDDNEEITLSQQCAAKDLPQRLMSFIRSHPDWHHKILTYEPLDLGVLKEDLKAAGIKCSNDKLLDFLDEKCITFTTKNMVPRKRRNRGRKPKSKKVAASQK